MDCTPNRDTKPCDTTPVVRIGRHASGPHGHAARRGRAVNPMLGPRRQFSARPFVAGPALALALATRLLGQSPGIAVTATVSTQFKNQSYLITALLTAAAPGPPITGTVTFYAGTKSLGSSPVEAATPNAGGPSTATATLTFATPVGVVAAYYSGDTNYAAGPPFVLTTEPEVATLLTVTSGLSL